MCVFQTVGVVSCVELVLLFVANSYLHAVTAR